MITCPRARCCRWLPLALLLVMAGSGRSQQPSPPSTKAVRQTKESVPWALAAYKLVEYFQGKEGYAEVYDGQPVAVTGLVSNVENAPGSVALLLYEDRVMAIPAKMNDPQFGALCTFFEQERRAASNRSGDYRNFFVKATVRGTCASSRRVGKIDLRDASLLAWYGVRVTRQDRRLVFEVVHRHDGERVAHYQRMYWERERKAFKGVPARLTNVSRQLTLTVDRMQFLMDADPLSLLTEAMRIIEISKANAIAEPLELTLAAYPFDDTGMRFHETSIQSWRVKDRLAAIYDVVDNIGGPIDLKPPVTVEPGGEQPAAAATEAPPDERKTAQAFAIAANNLLAQDLNDPKGRLYLAFATFLLPDHEQLVEMRAKVNTRTPLTALPTQVSELDLLTAVTGRLKELASGRNLHHPQRRRLCAFYVGAARELGVGEDELKPVLLSLGMFEQPTDLPTVAGIIPAAVRNAGAITELEGAVSGQDPDQVDLLLGRAEALAKEVGEDPRLGAIITRLERHRKFWDEVVPCPDCGGKGGAEKICPACNGNGKVMCRRCHWTGKVEELKSCPKCNGTGKVFGIMACKECNGAGKVKAMATCPDCGGKGVIPCSACNGAGKSRTPCTTCGGAGFRKRRDLPRAEQAPPAEE